MTEPFVIEDEVGQEWIWDEEGQVFVGEDGEELDPDEFEPLEKDDSAGVEEEQFEYALAASAAELESHLGRKLSETEVARIVEAAESIGTVDAATAYAASTGSQNTQPSDRAADRSEIARAIGAPDPSTDEGRIQLTAQYAQDVQDADADDEGEEAD
jgi:hypothetical protein